MDRHSPKEINGMADDQLEQEPMLKQGMVLKRGRKVTSTWKKRYFVLRPTTLSYHAGMDTDNEEKRYIEITQSSTVTHRPDKHPLCFQVRTPGYRKITARCETEEELQLWMTAIDECIRRAPAWPIKCVVVGDDEEPTLGKRVMVNRYLDACRGRIEDGEAKMMNPHGYTLDKSRTRIVKTPDELGNVDILLEYEKGAWVKLMLWHLDGSEQCTKLRVLAYPHSDIFIVVFSVSDSRSFDRVDSYMKEIHNEKSIFLLVGTRVSSELVSIGFNQGEEKARALGFAGYVECRIDSEEDCEQVFTDAVRLVVEKSGLDDTHQTGGENLQESQRGGHSRASSGILMALAHRLTGGKKSSSQEHPGSSASSTVDSDHKQHSPDTSPTHLKRKGFFTGTVLSPLRTSATRKSDLSTKSTTSAVPTHSSPLVRASVNDGEEDSDEGSLIGVEIDDADEDAKARLDRDFGLIGMKDDASYTQKILTRNSSRRSGEQGFGASSNSLPSTSHRSGAELFDIEETAAEERERELEDLRVKDAKRAKEIEKMKQMMDNLKTHNKQVEDQLRAMREELALVNKKGGVAVGVPPKMPPLTLSPPAHQGSLPPRPPAAQQQTRPAAAEGSIGSNNSARTNRAASVFF